MPFPLISEYILAIQEPENFLTLKGAKPVKNNQGQPHSAAGGFAVVFKISNGGRTLALKCFLKDSINRKQRFTAIGDYLAQVGSPYFVKYQYLPNELYVDGSEYDVVAMDWIEGQTLGSYLKDKATKGDKTALQAITDKMDELAKHLLGLSLAHGDLKPDNILVTPDGNLKLVDYDGMFVPAFVGQPSPELGTPAYQHPLRAHAHYHRHLDDVSLLILCLSLRAIAENPALLQHSDGEILLLTAEDMRKPMETATWKNIFALKPCRPWLETLFDVLKTNTLKAEEKDWEKLVGRVEGIRPRANVVNQPLPKVQTFTVNGVSFDMILVEGGTFEMGYKEGRDRRNGMDEELHFVTLRSFYLSRFVVTQAIWNPIMDNNSNFKGNDLPVETVSWTETQVFISKLNMMLGQFFRLPTESEWEFAARGGNKSKGYQYAGSNNIDEVAEYSDNNNSTTKPVGRKKPNELGLYDMSGNVWEWCQDWHGKYSSLSQTNPQGPDTGTLRIIRGGSWYDNAWYAGVANSFFYSPDTRRDNLGFRLAMSV